MCGLQSVPMTKEELIKNFTSLPDWEEKYIYLIELGETLPTMPSELVNDDTKIQGCSSQAWLDLKIIEGKIFLAAKADSQIVRGMLAIIYILYNALNLNEARKINLTDFFAQIGLMNHLSLSRQNGLASIAKLINNLLSK
jgi:cysteine desulfuration protein SufE